MCARKVVRGLKYMRAWVRENDLSALAPYPWWGGGERLPTMGCLLTAGRKCGRTGQQHQQLSFGRPGMAAQIPEATWDCATVTSSQGPGDTGDWQGGRASPRAGRMDVQLEAQELLHCGNVAEAWPVTQMDAQRFRQKNWPGENWWVEKAGEGGRI